MQTPQTQLFMALMLQNSVVEVLLVGSVSQAASRISKAMEEDGGVLLETAGLFPAAHCVSVVLSVRECLKC